MAKKNKTIEIPGDLWVEFIGLIYTAIQHIDATTDNIDIMNYFRSVIGGAFRDGDILIVDGKIIDKNDL